MTSPQAARFYRWLKWRAGTDGECHWSQSKIAGEFQVDVRTVQRWTRELVRSGLISAERRRRQSQLVTVTEARQMTLDFSVENSAMSGQDVGLMSGLMSGQMSGLKSPCIRAKEVAGARGESLESLESLESKPLADSTVVDVVENRTSASQALTTLQMPPAAGFVDFLRTQTRFERHPGSPDEGTLERLARILVDEAGYQAWSDKAADWVRRGNRIESWGILVRIAEDVARSASGRQAGTFPGNRATGIPVPADCRPLAEAEAYVATLARPKRFPQARAPAVDSRVRTMVESQARWRRA